MFFVMKEQRASMTCSFRRNSREGTQHVHEYLRWLSYQIVTKVICIDSHKTAFFGTIQMYVCAQTPVGRLYYENTVLLLVL